MARRGGFQLTAPTLWLFGISVVLAILALLMRYAGLSIPAIGTAHVFDVLVIAYLVLVAGVVFKGI
jgi:hypothetical protein